MWEFPETVLRPLRPLPALREFVQQCIFRMLRNFLKLRWVLFPIDLAVLGYEST